MELRCTRLFPYYVVGAFANGSFSGNPAGVCVLDQWLDDNTMLAIAAENRLSETAFCVKEGDGEYSLRWFTPVAEIDLCGHATFGAAYTLFTFYGKDAQQLVFNAPLAGHRLVCTRVENRIEMVFPTSLLASTTILTLLKRLFMPSQAAFLQQIAILLRCLTAKRRFIPGKPTRPSPTCPA